MIFELSGGGGAGLNYKVVGGTTQPTSPSENTIWINTSAKITGHVFDVNQPAGSEGLVWIQTGTSSSVPFNALKKNTIQVYPIGAKQYISGAWVDVTAKTYQNGAWVDWAVFLFKNGNRYESLTGGWGTGYKTNAAFGAVNASFGSEIGFSISREAGKLNYCQIAATKNKINLTNANKLRFKFTSVGGNSGYVRAGIARSLDFTSSSAIVSYLTVNSAGDVYIDTSGITGEFYVFCGVSSDWGADTGMSASAKVSEIEVV